MLPLHVSLSLRTGVFTNWPKEMNGFSACHSQRVGVVKDLVLLIKKRGSVPGDTFQLELRLCCWV